MVPKRLEMRRQPVTFTIVMSISSVNLKHTVTALGVALWLCGPVVADERTEQLFETLRTAPEEEARRAARDIERSWASSGSAAMDLLLKRGRDALEIGEIEQAIEHLTALTDHAPEFAEGFHTRAMAYFQADLFGPALDDLETTLALNPENYQAIYGLAVMFQELGDTGRAASLYRRALAINPHMDNAAEALERLKRDGIGITL